MQRILFTLLLILQTHVLASDRYAAAHSHFASKSDSSGTVLLTGLILLGTFLIYLAFASQKHPKSRR
jgi:hypothetical protein